MQQRQRQARGPVVRAEDAHGAGGHPVHQRWLVEEADAVDGRRHVVVPPQHLAGDLGVDGVDVIQQAGREEATDVEERARRGR